MSQIGNFQNLYTLFADSHQKKLIAEKELRN